MAILDVLMRYIHIVSAVLAVGGAFLLLIAVPAGLGLIDNNAKRDAVLLRIRRSFKLIVHPAILGLLVSGVYNTVRLWPTYKLNMARHHMFWGPHLLVGLVIIGISLWLLAGKDLRTNHRKWLKINVVLMLVTILLASSLRHVRLDSVRTAHQQEVERLKSQLNARGADTAAVAPQDEPTALPSTQPAGNP